jgi:hypothetical protein
MLEITWIENHNEPIARKVTNSQMTIPTDGKKSDTAENAVNTRQLACVHCTNTDGKMMEIMPSGYVLCYVCSKKFDPKQGRNPEPPPDVVCSHGTAMDVHCCNCHSGFIFDIDHECPEEV